MGTRVKPKKTIGLSELSRVDPARLTKAVPFYPLTCKEGSCSGTVRYATGVYTLELKLDGGRFYLMRSATKPEDVYALVVEVIRQYAEGTLYELGRVARVGREGLDPRVVVDWSK